MIFVVLSVVCLAVVALIRPRVMPCRIDRSVTLSNASGFPEDDFIVRVGDEYVHVDWRIGNDFYIGDAGGIRWEWRKP